MPLLRDTLVVRATERLREAAPSLSDACDVLACCAVVCQGCHAATAELATELLARDDNPCWLPHEVFDDLVEIVDNPRNLRAIIRVIINRAA